MNFRLVSVWSLKKATTNSHIYLRTVKNCYLRTAENNSFTARHTITYTD